MLVDVIPKLPMRDRVATLDFYTQTLNFRLMGDYGNYLLLRKDNVEIHFFLFEDLNPLENYGQIYIRTEAIHRVYQDWIQRGVSIHPNGPLSLKPWGQWEFSLLDPDHNLLTFGQSNL